MKQMLKDYELSQNTMNLFIENSSAIQISKNSVQHSKTKHIDIRHHFIRELVEEKTISIAYIKIKHQLAKILTKPLDAKNSMHLRNSVGECEMS